MNKNTIIGILIVVLIIVIGVVAYFLINNNQKNEENNQTNETTQKEESSESTTNVGSNVLVVYFSAQGHTKEVAEKIADNLNADIFEITPANPYTEEDLDYNDDNSRVSREYEDESLRDVELETTEVPNSIALSKPITLPVKQLFHSAPQLHLVLDKVMKNLPKKLELETGKKVIALVLIHRTLI